MIDRIPAAHGSEGVRLDEVLADAVARGLGTWSDVRDLSLPQIRVALAACDRRDAALALRSLETTHAAVAPLMVGRSGSSVFDRCVNTLRSIIWPSRAKPDTPFRRLLASAQRQLPRSPPPPP